MLMTAIRYNQVNSVIICAIGLILLVPNGFPRVPLLKWSAHASTWTQQAHAFRPS